MPVGCWDYTRIKALAADTPGVRVTDLLALAPQNDPLYAGTPADREQAAWFAALWQRGGFSRAHLRRVHYWTVSQDPPAIMPNGKAYVNTEACWKYLTQASKMARYLGLVPIEDVVDHKNPPANVQAFYSGALALDYDLFPPELDEPAISVYGPQAGDVQPYHLEVWCEKSTMNDVLLPVCRRYGANLVTFEGEASVTACYDLVRRVQQADRPARIFYISDFDPAGNSMPVATARKVEYMLTRYGAGQDVRLRALALTLDQVRAYRLPRTPIKETERRAGRFEEAFGEGATELDALEALHPGVLARLVDDALRPYYSDAARRAADDVIEDLRQAIRDEAQAIMDRYRAELDALQAMNDELRAIYVDASDYVVAPAEPDVSEDDAAWLFASGRDYMTQLGYYKAHKGATNGKA
ncbi:MAG TPA: hypothetical protein PKD46_16805 [Aggregatilineaceae bacterium]|nr:hypothetical protein [Aggregatilineaceae bacterium]